MGQVDGGLSHSGAVRGVFNPQSSPGGKGGAARTVLCPVGRVMGGAEVMGQEQGGA